MDRPVDKLFRTLNDIDRTLEEFRGLNTTAWSNIHGPAIEQCWDPDADADIKSIQKNLFPVLDTFDNLKRLVDHAQECYEAEIDRQLRAKKLGKGA